MVKRQILTDGQLRRWYRQGLRNFSYTLLSGADLEGFELKYISLRGADLRRANLKNIDLTHADLQATNFVGADLTGARLHDAFLQRADLREAILTGADFSGATLEGATLQGALYDKKTQWPTGFFFGSFDPVRAGARLIEGTLGTSGHSHPEAPDTRTDKAFPKMTQPLEPAHKTGHRPLWEDTPSGSFWDRLAIKLGIGTPPFGWLVWDERGLKLLTPSHTHEVKWDEPMSVQLDVWFKDEHWLEATLSILNKGQRNRLRFKSLLKQSEVHTSVPVQHIQAPWVRRRDFIEIWGVLLYCAFGQGLSLHGQLNPKR